MRVQCWATRGLLAGAAVTLGLATVGVPGAVAEAEEIGLFEGWAVSAPLRGAANVAEIFAPYSEASLTNSDGSSHATWLYPGAVGTAVAETEGLPPPAAKASYPPGGEQVISFASPPGAPAPPEDDDPGRAEARAGERESHATVAYVPFSQRGVTIAGGSVTTTVSRVGATVTSSARQEITGVRIGEALRFDAIRAVAETTAGGGSGPVVASSLELVGGTLGQQVLVVSSDGRITPAGDARPLLTPGKETLQQVLEAMGFRARILEGQEADLEGGKSVESPGLLIESTQPDAYAAFEFGRVAAAARALPPGGGATEDGVSTDDVAPAFGSDSSSDGAGNGPPSVVSPGLADTPTRRETFERAFGAVEDAPPWSGTAPLDGEPLPEAEAIAEEAAAAPRTALAQPVSNERALAIGEQLADVIGVMAKILIAAALLVATWPRLIRALSRA
jgi:hypothetical protein